MVCFKSPGSKRAATGVQTDSETTGSRRGASRTINFWEGRILFGRTANDIELCHESIRVDRKATIAFVGVGLRPFLTPNGMMSATCSLSVATLAVPSYWNEQASASKLWLESPPSPMRCQRVLAVLRCLAERPHRCRSGRQCRGPRAPARSISRRLDFRLLRDFQCVIDFNAQIPNRALELCMAKQQLDSPEILRPFVNQGRFRSAHRMRPIARRVETDHGHPLINNPRVLTCFPQNACFKTYKHISATLDDVFSALFLIVYSSQRRHTDPRLL